MYEREKAKINEKIEGDHTLRDHGLNETVKLWSYVV